MSKPPSKAKRNKNRAKKDIRRKHPHGNTIRFPEPEAITRLDKNNPVYGKYKLIRGVCYWVKPPDPYRLWISEAEGAFPGHAMVFWISGGYANACQRHEPLLVTGRHGLFSPAQGRSVCLLLNFENNKIINNIK